MRKRKIVVVEISCIPTSGLVFINSFSWVSGLGFASIGSIRFRLVKQEVEVLKLSGSGVELKLLKDI